MLTISLLFRPSDGGEAHQHNYRVEGHISDLIDFDPVTALLQLPIQTPDDASGVPILRQRDKGSILAEDCDSDL